MNPYDQLAQELFNIMDPEKHRPPHQNMSKMMHGEMAVMRLLDREDDALLAGELSRKLSMSTPRITAVLNSLEKKGMICRCEDPQDRRRVIVKITQAGSAFNREKRGEVIGHMRTMLEMLGEEDAHEYVRLTRRAFTIMQEQCKNQGGNL